MLPSTTTQNFLAQATSVCHSKFIPSNVRVTSAPEVEWIGKIPSPLSPRMCNYFVTSSRDHQVEARNQEKRSPGKELKSSARARIGQPRPSCAAESKSRHGSTAGQQHCQLVTFANRGKTCSFEKWRSTHQSVREMNSIYESMYEVSKTDLCGRHRARVGHRGANRMPRR